MIQGFRLEVQEGLILHVTAMIGDDALQEILDIPSARRFGETQISQIILIPKAAIGTNPFIQTPTKNILFDEKMSGTVQMALGQSYLQCGGKIESSIHLDLIADMKRGEI